MIKEVTLTKEQKDAAKVLGTGEVIFAYFDGKSIHMETEVGKDPYVWRNNKWVPMK